MANNSMEELETASATLSEANLASLIAAKALVDTYDAGLAALNDALPANFPLEAKRKIGEMRSALIYLNLEYLIAQYSPPLPVTLPEGTSADA